MKGLWVIGRWSWVIAFAGLQTTGAPNAFGGAADEAMVVTPLLSRLPMSFEANRGQFDLETRFVARGPGYAFRLGPADSSLVLRRPVPGAAFGVKSHRGRYDLRTQPRAYSVSSLRMTLIGSNPRSSAVGLEALPVTVNYFIGNDPQQWRTSIPSFAKVRYDDVYSGIALVYYGNQRQLEYDFVVAPGADPDRILIRFEGADSLRVDPDGDLVAEVDGSEVRWQKPRCFQITTSGTNEVAGGFELKGERGGTSGQGAWNLISFRIGAYDRTLPLVIDPVLLYSTFYGGSDYEVSAGLGASAVVAVDTNGNAYFSGETLSVNVAVTNAFRTTNSGLSDVFVGKLGSSGSNLVYATYIGGTDNDAPHGIALDGSGNAYIVGQTLSMGFPTKNPYKTAGSLAYSYAFLTKLGPAGTNLLYSTYYGGDTEAGGTAIAVGSNGDAYITGFVLSGRNDGFTTRNAFQSSPGGPTGPQDELGDDAFVAKFSTTNTLGNASLVYSSYLGGADEDFGFGIAADAGGNAYVVGDVNSSTYDLNGLALSSFPVTANALRPYFNLGDTNAFGTSDGFVVKVGPTGAAKLTASFLGGTDYDSASAVALDPAGNVYVTGFTTSEDFPVTGDACQAFNGGEGSGSEDAFVVKLGNGCTNELYGTYFGGSAPEFGNAVAVDGFGGVYVAGQTLSEDMPVTPGAVQTTNGFNSYAGFALKLSPAVPGGSALVYSTYLGGQANEFNTASGVALDTNGNFYVAGLSDSTNGFPTTAGALQRTNRGGNDAFVMKFSAPVDLSVANVASVSSPLVGDNVVYTLHVNNNGRGAFSSVVLTDQLPPQLQLLSAVSSIGICTTNTNTVTCILGSFTNNASAVVTVTAKTVGSGTVTNAAVVSSTETAGGFEVNTNNNRGPVVTFIRGIADVAVTVGAAPSPVFVTSNLTYSVGVTNKGPSAASSILVSNVLPAGVVLVSSNATLGGIGAGSGLVVWSVSNLSVGSGALLTLVVAAPASVATLTNRASVSAFDLDTFPGNNAATNTTAVSSQADLRIVTLSGSPNPVTIGSNLTYSIVVSNRGSSPATGTVLSNPIPAGTVFVSASGSYSTNGGVVTYNLGTLSAGASSSMTIVVKPTGAGTIVDTATLGSSVPDGNMSDNTATATTTAAAFAGPLLKITFSGTNALLYWPTSAPGFALQFAPRLGLTNTNAWSYVSNAPGVVSNQYFVTNALVRSNRFYRLIK